MHKLKGDTLIEVALAIGIFSMVAVAVVSVVSASTSSAQSALEVTVTREEIDAQAEALRFIQASYIAGGQSDASKDYATNLAGDVKYSSLWNAIKARAISYDSSDRVLYDAALDYSPTTCSKLYDGNDSTNLASLFNQRAFIINTRNLGLSYENATPTAIRDLTSNIIVPATTSRFFEAATYPRIIYSADNENAYSNIDTAPTLLDPTHSYYPISRVEGLYIVALKDTGTNVVEGSGGSARPSTNSAYYDFYIRSCWFAPGADHPSTISTVIRLYDPAVIQY